MEMKEKRDNYVKSLEGFFGSIFGFIGAILIVLRITAFLDFCDKCVRFLWSKKLIRVIVYCSTTCLIIFITCSALYEYSDGFRDFWWNFWKDAGANYKRLFG